MGLENSVISLEGTTKMAPAKARSSLDALGTGDDIKSLIVDHINRPSDLKSVALVNKQFHKIAVKRLYRHVALDLGSSNDKRLAGFLSPSNIGLQYVRHMRLYLANVRDRCNQEQQAHIVTRMILEFLPKNVLEEFSWCPWTTFSADNLLLLYRNQKKLRWIEAMDLDRDILPELKKDENQYTETFQHTRKLALYPEDRETLRLCEYFVQKTKDTVEEIILHANFNEPAGHGEFIELRELNDSAIGPGLVTRTMFSHMLPFASCEPLKNLTCLRIHRINLRYAADTWCKFVNFHQIEALRVYQCPGADSLFGQLSRAASLPKKLRVLEFQHKDNSENEALLALDGFLCLVSGIRDLVIDFEGVKSLPAAAGIARHGKTLEILNVHCSPESAIVSSSSEDVDELVWDADSFGKICEACTKLEQLSCAWPPTSLIRSPSEEWRAFERGLANLKELVTLHSSTFPSSKQPGTFLPRVVYEQLLQGVASTLFESASNPPVSADTDDDDDSADGNETPPQNTVEQRRSKLRLIAFGISDKIYEREDSKSQLIYLRSTCQDAEGKAKLYAAPISWTLRQYVEPRSEVLDFVLSKDVRVPVREGQPSGIGWNDDDEFVDV